MDLKDCKLQDADDVKLVAGDLKQQACCTRLDLANCDIGDGGCEALANGLVHCSTLRELVLSNNKIGDNGAFELSKTFKHCTQMQSLNISRNSIGASGMMST